MIESRHGTRSQALKVSLSLVCERKRTVKETKSTKPVMNTLVKIGLVILAASNETKKKIKLAVIKDYESAFDTFTL